VFQVTLHIDLTATVDMSLNASAPPTIKKWSPTFMSRQPQSTSSAALIILNQPFSFLLLQRLWTSCSWRCCADGGANRLYDILVGTGKTRDFLPDLIKGDLDSLRPDVRKYYEEEGVEIVRDHDQYSSDLMKCFDSLSSIEERAVTQFPVIILGGLSGRIDQTIHTMSRVYKLRKTRDHVYVATDDDISWLLDSGAHEIEIDRTVLGPTCGLLPVGIASSTITTRGLEWDLTEQETSFEGLVSTSNAILGDRVFVETTQPIWWNVVLKSLER